MNTVSYKRPQPRGPVILHHMLRPSTIVGSLLFLLIASFLIFTITMVSGGFIEQTFRLNDWNVGTNTVSGPIMDVGKHVQPLLGVKKISIMEKDGVLWVKLYYNQSIQGLDTFSHPSSRTMTYKLQYSEAPVGFHMTGLVKYIDINQYFVKEQGSLALISLNYHLCITALSTGVEVYKASSQQCVEEARLSIDAIYVGENVFKIGWLVLGIFLPLIPVATYISSIDVGEETKSASVLSILIKYKKIIYTYVFLMDMCFLIFSLGLFLTVFPLIIIPYTVMILITQIFSILVIIAICRMTSPLHRKPVITLIRISKQRPANILFSLLKWSKIIVVVGLLAILIILMINITTEHLSLLLVEVVKAYPLTSLVLLLSFSITPLIFSKVVRRENDKEKREEEIRNEIVAYLMLLNAWLFVIVFRVLVNYTLVCPFARAWLIAFIPIAITSSYFITYLIEHYMTYKTLYEFYKRRGLRSLSIWVSIVISVPIVLSILRCMGLIRPLPMLTDMILFLQLALILILWFIYVRTNVYQKVFLALEESFT